MSEPVDTMKVRDKESGEEVTINVSDFDPDKYEEMESVQEDMPAEEV